MDSLDDYIETLSIKTRITHVWRGGDGLFYVSGKNTYAVPHAFRLVAVKSDGGWLKFDLSAEVALTLGLFGVAPR